MIANQTGLYIGYLAAKYPGALGHLYSPGAERGPWSFLPYALDNGAYGAWFKKTEWNEDAWLRLLAWSARARIRPLWCLVPDVVASREATIESWHRHVGQVSAHGFRPAFAVQDGMTFDDVPEDDCMLFLGGTTDWKEAAIPLWCARFPGRVHVGRVNRRKRLWACHRAGAVSVDGTGWWHKDNGQHAELLDFIKRARP